MAPGVATIASRCHWGSLAVSIGTWKIAVMKRFLPPVLALPALALFTVAPLAAQKKPYPTLGTIERKDPRFDMLVPKEAVLEKLAEGFEWAEGPVWIAKGGYLLFS